MNFGSKEGRQIYWCKESMLVDFTKAALTGLLANRHYDPTYSDDEIIAQSAITLAKETIRLLGEEE